MPVDVHTVERYVMEPRGAIFEEDERRFVTGVREGEILGFVFSEVVQLEMFEQRGGRGVGESTQEGVKVEVVFCDKFELPPPAGVRE